MKFEKFLITVAAASSCIGIASIPAQAGSFFKTRGIYFDTDTTVEFTFFQSNGRRQVTFGVAQEDALDTSFQTLFVEKDPGYDPSDDAAVRDYPGTCGVTVDYTRGTPTCTATFKFLRNTLYTLVLKNKYFDNSTEPTVYSTTSLNQAHFSEAAIFKGNLSQGVRVFFDDRPFDEQKRIDNDDFIVHGKVKSIPAPGIVGGFALVAAAMMSRPSKLMKTQSQSHSLCLKGAFTSFIVTFLVK